jgi:hypothetical protein
MAKLRPLGRLSKSYSLETDLITMFKSEMKRRKKKSQDGQREMGHCACQDNAQSSWELFVCSYSVTLPYWFC